MLEVEIKRLTETIERLIVALERSPSPAPEQQPEAKAEKAQEPEPKTQEPEPKAEQTQEAAGYTNDSIKSMALAISRKDRSKQVDIKAKLAEHGAKVATDLSGDALQAVGDWLEALKAEVGA